MSFLKRSFPVLFAICLLTLAGLSGYAQTTPSTTYPDYSGAQSNPGTYSDDSDAEAARRRRAAAATDASQGADINNPGDSYGYGYTNGDPTSQQNGNDPYGSYGYGSGAYGNNNSGYGNGNYNTYPNNYPQNPNNPNSTYPGGYSTNGTYQNYSNLPNGAYQNPTGQNGNAPNGYFPNGYGQNSNYPYDNYSNGSYNSPYDCFQNNNYPYDATPYDSYQNNTYPYGSYDSTNDPYNGYQAPTSNLNYGTPPNGGPGSPVYGCPSALLYQNRRSNNLAYPPMNPYLRNQTPQRRPNFYPPNPDEPVQPLVRNLPYPGIQSLRDLYAKTPLPTTPPRRFGSDVFLHGTGNANLLPSDLPAGPDYVLGPGDQLTLNLSGGRPGRLVVPVDRQGQVALPEAGSILVAGLSIAQAQSRIQTALAQQFRDEHVEISLGRLRTIRVYVVGDVQRPGGYDLSSLSTPLGVLFAAGGPTSRGSLRVLHQYRGDRLVRDIDVYDFLIGGKQAIGDRLDSGDTIVVPPTGPQVTVQGAVRRPAIYELKGPETLKDILDLAGGPLVTANLKQIQIGRVQANERRTSVSLDLPIEVAARNTTLSGFALKDGDTVTVSQILPYNEQAIYLEGHVFRPGKYAYRDGMTVNDLIHSYQDVLPEPSDHAEIVRLLPPDYHPETISINLADILIGNQVVHLQPLDLLQIFGRYETDAPNVSIQGEVLRPGRYPLSKGMNVTNLLNMAGGFRQDAFRSEVSLSSYAVVDGREVKLAETTVTMPTDGSPAPNIELKSGDIVSVHQLAGWQDIGASVIITGEVAHAGSYGIAAGERLSSVLRRAGGFNPTAYPAAAVFTRRQVRAIQEADRQQLIQQLESTPLTVRQNLSGDTNTAAVQQSLEAQRQQVITTLRTHPPTGRQVIAISADPSQWAGTPSDVELRAGDVLVIPKEPQFVVVAGEVFNPDALTYVPGKTAGWYLSRAGGANRFGDHKHVYVIRADGSVVSHGANFRGLLDVRLRPGDSIIVPAKINAPSELAKDLLAAAQIAASVGITAAVAFR